MNEAETRAELIDPKLKECGWGVVEGSKILREYNITAGKIQTGGVRAKKLTADYVLAKDNRIREFLDKYKDSAKDSGIIGHFGLGFYSAFMVAHTVEINSLSYQEGAEAAKWTCDGSTSFEISEGSRTERGTEITLHINEESEEFLDKWKLQSILDKYCKFLPVTIKFGTKTDSVEDGVDEEGKKKVSFI